MNLYGFVGNNPANRWDYLGMAFDWNWYMNVNPLRDMSGGFGTGQGDDYIGYSGSWDSGADAFGLIDSAFADAGLNGPVTGTWAEAFGTFAGDLASAAASFVNGLGNMIAADVTPALNNNAFGQAVVMDAMTVTADSAGLAVSAPNNAGPRDSVFPFDHITVATVGFVTSFVTPLTASQNTDAFINWVGLKNTGDLQAAKLTGQMLSVVGAAFGGASSAPAPTSVGANGRILTLDPSRYPIPLDTLNRAGVLYQPLTVNRPGAAGNRQFALSGLPRVPGMDLDEAPPAMFRNPGDPVLVQPTPPGQNRGAGASLGGQARGVSNGGTVIIVPGETWPR